MAGSDSLDWILGIGYVRLWEQVHRLEEELILIAPIPTVLGEAFADTLRLEGSNIPNRDALMTALAGATETLKRRAGIYIAGASPGIPTGPNDEGLARESLLQVRRSINEFRDERRQGLVRARNQLLKTFCVVNVVLLELIGFAVLIGVSRANLIAASVIYLVGAIIGLFNRLYLDASADTAVEDFGLSVARLLHAPVFAGIAAVGGVVMVPMLSVLANTSGETNTLSVPTLADIFNLQARPFSVMIALIFGLTPTALISRLQKEAEQYKADLKTSQTP